MHHPATFYKIHGIVLSLYYNFNIFEESKKLKYLQNASVFNFLAGH